jgi:ketosteroid isomerase-like protein
MAKGHADMVRRACAAWSHGDISVYREMYAPDVVADGGDLWMEAGTVQGVDAVIAGLVPIIDAFERSELVPVRIDEEGDSLVAELRWRGWLPGSDVPVEQRITSAYRFNGELIAFQGWYQDPEVARAAVDMGSAGASQDAPPR